MYSRNNFIALLCSQTNIYISIVSSITTLTATPAIPSADSMISSELYLEEARHTRQRRKEST